MQMMLSFCQELKNDNTIEFLLENGRFDLANLYLVSGFIISKTTIEKYENKYRYFETLENGTDTEKEKYKKRSGNCCGDEEHTKEKYKKILEWLKPKL